MNKLLLTAKAAGLCLGALLALTAPAAAQSDETATSMARERFKEGVQYFDQKQYDRARVAFLQAYALKRHPSVLLNLAQSELRSGHEADAAKHFSMFLREAQDATAAEREGAEAGLFAAKAVCGEVVVRVDVEGATIFIDGDEEGVAPLPDAVYLTPGSHEIEARKDGKSAKSSVTAKAGEAGEVRIRLKNARAAASTPGDSEPEHGDTSLPPEYDTASSEGGREGFFPWFGHTPLAWVGGGLAVVGVAGGVGFGLSAKQSYDDADAQAEEIRNNAVNDGATSTQGICLDPRSVAGLQDETMPRIAQYQEACSNHQDDVANGDRMKTFSMISWAVAGAATVGTIIYYFADAEDEPAEANAAQRPRVAAVVAPGYLGLQGSF